MDLMDSVDVLKGVGPKTATVLKKFGIKTVRDFVYNLPRDYENYDSPTSIAEMRPGKVVIRGKVSGLKTRQTKRRNLTITEGTVSDPSGSVRVVWFNQRYREHQFTPETEYFFTGNFSIWKDCNFEKNVNNLVIQSCLRSTAGKKIRHRSRRGSGLPDQHAGEVL